MSRKPRVELILEGYSNGKVIKRDMVTEERFAEHYPDQKIMLFYRPYSDMSGKEKLFAYLHGPLMHALTNALHDAGFEGSQKDFYRAMKSKFTAYVYVNPLTGKEEQDTLDFSSDSVTSAQLGQFVNDIILFMEKDMDVEAPDSELWKTQKRLGSSKITFKKDNHG